MGHRIVNLGIDYHQAGLRLDVMNQRGKTLVNCACFNDVRSIVQAVGPGLRVRGVAIEACTGASHFAEQLRRETGWKVQLAHPGIVSRLKTSPDKSDYSDAKLLADLVRTGYLPRVWLADEPTRELRKLIRFRQQLVDRRRSIKLQVTALLRENRVFKPPTLGGNWTLGWLAWLEKAALPQQSRWIVDRHLEMLRVLDKEIELVAAQLTAATAENALVKKLLTQPGIGPVTAWWLAAEVADFSRFGTGKQLARYCGLSPRNASSSKRVADAGLIKAANSQLRAVLIEAAHRLARTNTKYKALHDRLIAAGKHKCVAKAAVANRWVRWLYHQMLDRDAGQPRRTVAAAAAPPAARTKCIH